MSNAELALAIPALYFFVVAFPLVWIDLKERRLPNRLTLPGLALSALGLVSAAFLGEPLKALASFGVALALFIVGVFLSFRGWLGMGDVKLLSGVSLVVGAFDLSLVPILLGSVLVCVVVYAALFYTRQLKSNRFALGPAICLSYLLCLALIVIRLLG